MAVITHATLVALTKIQYPNGLEAAAYATSPLVGRIKKGKLEGTAVSHKIKHGPGNKASSGFTTIQTNANGSRVSEFLITNSYFNYSVFQISNEAIARNASNAAAVRSYVKTETDSALEDIGGQFAEALYGNGSGLIGVIASGDGTPTLTLATPQDIIHFEIGQRIDVSATLDGSGAVVGASTTEIAGVDREAGTITAGGNWPAGFVTGRGLYREGNYGVQASGMESWNPASTTAVTASFRNVVRSVDRQRLAGNNHISSGSDGTYLRCFSNALSKTRQAVKGAMPDELYVNPFVFDRVIQEMNDRTTWVTKPGRTAGEAPMGQFGYRGVEVTIGEGSCVLYQDIWCPRDVARLVEIDTWEILAVPGGFPRILEGGDGRTMENSDSKEFRMGAYWDTRCLNPGKNCRIDLSYLNGLAA